MWLVFVGFSASALLGFALGYGMVKEEDIRLDRQQLGLVYSNRPFWNGIMFAAILEMFVLFFCNDGSTFVMLAQEAAFGLSTLACLYLARFARIRKERAMM